MRESLTRSGLTSGTVPHERVDVDTESHLLRASKAVLSDVLADCEGAPLGFIVADRDGRIVDVADAHPDVGHAIDRAGVARGTRMTEADVGTNAIGTVLETRQPMLIRGEDHYLTAFQQFTCFGHPIIHPLTKRVEGVLNVGGNTVGDTRFFGPIARRATRDIQELLVQNSPVAQRRLLYAYHSAARRRGQAVLVLGEGLVLASPAALDLLDPADHATIRAYADGADPLSPAPAHLVLSAGHEVDVTGIQVEGTDGMLVNLTVAERSSTIGRAESPTVAFPLLITGEPGSGRSTEARRIAPCSSNSIDAADIFSIGPSTWLKQLDAATRGDGPPVIVENIQVLNDACVTQVARLLVQSPRPVVVTADQSEDDDVHAAIVAICRSRRDLRPLRHRRHEIPRLAVEMLAAQGASSSLRLSAETLRVLASQPWPGNFTELSRVIEHVARTRAAGDIVPTDLPIAYRNQMPELSPRHLAERDAILSALSAAGGNKVQAARSLGVSRATLYNRLRTLKIT